MTNTPSDAMGLSESEIDALEALLVSDAVPEDCMSLEMLDGYLAAVLSAPVPIRPSRWLPSVWAVACSGCSRWCCVITMNWSRQ